ncbi:MAG: GNAT family N-acetyltransferase [Thioalkalivibrionaceae bacterium]
MGLQSRRLRCVELSSDDPVTQACRRMGVEIEESGCADPVGEQSGQGVRWSPSIHRAQRVKRSAEAGVSARTVVLGDRRASPELFAAIDSLAPGVWLERANAHQHLGGEIARMFVLVDACITPAWLDAVAAVVGALRAGGELEFWLDPALARRRSSRFVCHVLDACEAIAVGPLNEGRSKIDEHDKSERESALENLARPGAIRARARESSTARSVSATCCAADHPPRFAPFGYLSVGQGGEASAGATVAAANAGTALDASHFSRGLNGTDENASIKRESSVQAIEKRADGDVDRHREWLTQWMCWQLDTRCDPSPESSRTRASIDIQNSTCAPSLTQWNETRAASGIGCGGFDGSGVPSVVLVKGPRGAGKSTLVAEAWLQVAGRGAAALGFKGGTLTRIERGSAPVLIARYPTASARFEVVAAAGGARLVRHSSPPVGANPIQTGSGSGQVFWIVEEAAQWPVETILSWAREGRALCLVTTTAGYEGSGSSFEHLLLAGLSRLSCRVTEIVLRDTRRANTDDAVGRWLDAWWPEIGPRVFARSTGSDRTPVVVGRGLARTAGESAARVAESGRSGVNEGPERARTRLLTHWLRGNSESESDEPEMRGTEAVEHVVLTTRGVTESSLESVRPALNWLARGHYRTRPADIWRWLDDDSLRLFTIERVPSSADADAKVSLVAAVLVQHEPGLDASLREEIRGGRRRPGSARVTGAAALCGRDEIAGSSAWRVVRLLVAPPYRGQGMGRTLLDAVAESAVAAGVTTLAASFGETPELAVFWARCGFAKLWTSLRRDPMTGRSSCVVTRDLRVSVVAQVTSARSE